MDKASAEQLQVELIVTAVTLILMVLAQVFLSLPEWKRNMLIMEIKIRLRLVDAPEVDELSPHQLRELKSFLREMSDWDADQRHNPMAPRDPESEGN